MKDIMTDPQVIGDWEGTLWDFMDLEKKKREREERERDLGLLLGASTGYSFLVLWSMLEQISLSSGTLSSLCVEERKEYFHEGQISWVMDNLAQVLGPMCCLALWFIKPMEREGGPGPHSDVKTSQTDFPWCHFSEELVLRKALTVGSLPSQCC